MDTLTKLNNEASRSHEQWGAIRGRRAERQRALQDLHHKTREAERESEAYSLLPESERPAADVDPAQIAEIDGELDRLERLEQEACAIKDETAEELQREIRRLFPAAIERVQEANADVRKHLAEMGQAVVQPYLELLGSQTALAEADAALISLQGQLGGSDRKLRNRQQNAVRGVLDGGLQDASDAEILGEILASVLKWSRRGSSPIEDLWMREGLSMEKGSVFHELPHIPDVIQLRNRRLTRRAS